MVRDDSKESQAKDSKVHFKCKKWTNKIICLIKINKVEGWRDGPVVGKALHGSAWETVPISSTTKSQCCNILALLWTGRQAGRIVQTGRAFPRTHRLATMVYAVANNKRDHVSNKVYKAWTDTWSCPWSLHVHCGKYVPISAHRNTSIYMHHEKGMGNRHLRDWRAGLAVKNTCSCRGPGFCSQYPQSI